jgi:hypothetical protein
MPFPTYNIQAYIDRLKAINTGIYGVVAHPCSMKLFKNDVSPDANMTVDTFVEADFDGYAAIEIAMALPVLNDQGMVVSMSALQEFLTDAGVDVQTIYGVYLTNDTNTKVIAAQRFELPQVMGGVYPQCIRGVWRTSEPLSSYGWLDAEI